MTLPNRVHWSYRAHNIRERPSLRGHNSRSEGLPSLSKLGILEL